MNEKPDILYSIKSLQNLADKHSKEIEKINDLEPEMTSDMMFIEDEIKNHHRIIDGINYCISILSKEL
jgi:hypothetical protein